MKNFASMIVSAGYSYGVKIGISCRNFWRALRRPGPWCGRLRTGLRLGLLGCALCLLAGCKTVNVSSCSVADTPGNREDVGHILKSVADKFGFEDESAQFKELSLVGAYAYWGSNSVQHITLVADVSSNNITTTLAEVKNGKTRTSKFREVDGVLTNGFEKWFGTNVQVRSYNEKFGL